LDGRRIIGSITEAGVLSVLLEAPDRNGDVRVRDVMEAAPPIVPEDTGLSQLSRYFGDRQKAVVVRDKAMSYHILTAYDLLQNLG